MNLRVEHNDHPLGLTMPAPRLSWQLPAGAPAQIAYQIRAGAWDSGRVESAECLLVPYGGPALRSGERVEWAVRVWSGDGVSEWSAPSWWEMGLLDAADWSASWIEPAVPSGFPAASPRPAHLMRGSFSVGAPVRRARLYATAHGIYELFLNGHRVGDLELTPGFTSYSSTLQVQTYDVAELLVPGENVLGAVLSDGWYRGQVGGCRMSDLYGSTTALLAQLDVEGTDGSRVRTGTGPGWVSSTGGIIEADLMQGQVVDQRREPLDWCMADGSPRDHQRLDTPECAQSLMITGSSDWSPVVTRDFDLTRLRASPAAPVRRVEELRPVAVSQVGTAQVVDLGQNINGWVRLADLGPAGTSLTLTYGEALDAEGDVTQDNIVVVFDEEMLSRLPDQAKVTAPFQVDRVTSAGRPGEVFEPRHTTHGFRYVRVEGHPRELTSDDVTGVVVHTDFRRTGWFECSDERLNKLHEAAVWSFRGNACDIPTDCPTRECAGWAGDWQLFVPAAAFLYDVAGFSTKWLRDLAAEQRADGLVLECVPNIQPPELHEVLGVSHGSAGWGDAAVIVPWEIYRAYGDVQLLAEQWSSMTAWVDYAARVARDHRHPSRVAARPTPSPYERYLWDTGFHYGEWLEPGDWELEELATNLQSLARADHGEPATAYLHRSAALVAAMARVLGRDDDAVRYEALAAATRAAWQEEFVDDGGRLASDTQAGYVRALSFGLVPDEFRARAAARLVELIRAAGTHLGTGFLATPYLLPVLADTGHLGVAYELLFQDTEPSWLTMIDRGATTVWEGWDGVDEHGAAHLSLNHYSKGAVVSFLHHYVAGIQLLDDGPAYRRFRVAPMPGGGLTWARAEHDSPYGRIESSWRINGDRFHLDVVIPPGTSAEVRLPDGQVTAAAAGAHSFACPTPMING